MGSDIKVLGHNPATGDPYFVRDGVVWYGFSVRHSANCGTLEEFEKQVREGKWRFKPVSNERK